MINKKKTKKNDIDQIISTAESYIPLNPKCVPLTSLSNHYNARIIVVVAETLTYEKYGKPAAYKMGVGRMAAQVAHVTSKLKLAYAIANLGSTISTIDLLDGLANEPITTIILKARDSEEVQHIMGLAEEKDLLHVAFADDNEKVYGVPHRILTSIAIGPVLPEHLVGVTDYLPLWKEASDSVK